MKDNRDNFNLVAFLFVGLSLVVCGNQEPVLLIPLVTLCCLIYSIIAKSSDDSLLVQAVKPDKETK